MVTKDDLKNTGCTIKDPIQRVYNKNLSYPNILLVIVERKARLCCSNWLIWILLLLQQTVTNKKWWGWGTKISKVLKKLKNLIINNLGGKTQHKMKRNCEISEELISVIYIMIITLILLILARNDTIIYWI